MFKRIVLAITFITFSLFTTNVSMAEENSPQDFVKYMYNTSIKIYKINKTSPKQGLQESLDFIANNFAILSSARFVLGRSIHKLNKAQYETFKTDLTAMLSYAIREKIGGMHAKEFHVTGVVTRGHSLFVSSKLILPDGSKIHGDWRIRKSSKTNKFLVQDIIIEGVSIIKSYKDSTAQQLKQLNYDIEKFLAEKGEEVKAIENGEIPKTMTFVKKQH